MKVQELKRLDIKRIRESQEILHVAESKRGRPR
jgi:hypothetical protein